MRSMRNDKTRVAMVATDVQMAQNEVFLRVALVHLWVTLGSRWAYACRFEDLGVTLGIGDEALGVTWGLLWVYMCGWLWVTFGSRWAYDTHMCGPDGAET